ncbi:hypothetical protein GCM10009759_47710 [Kitasatospora saccharophila]|uniref:Uncharacterized protein n=1 Tax=Kitasatospora saccharophila TaxID=407973 RepID=A0ABP5IYW1_9ACTN
MGDSSGRLPNGLRADPRVGSLGARSVWPGGRRGLRGGRSVLLAIRQAGFRAGVRTGSGAGTAV